MLARVVSLGLALFGLALAAHAEEPKEKKQPEETILKPIAIFAGTHSQIKYETFNVITTEEGWKELWDKQRGEQTIPGDEREFLELNIDFKTHYIVCRLLLE